MKTSRAIIRNKIGEQTFDVPPMLMVAWTPRFLGKAFHARDEESQFHICDAAGPKDA
jgi:hypothetical protein